MIIDFNSLKEKARQIRKETLNLSRVSASFRLASSLSPIEIFVVLYYSGIMRFNPKNPRWEERDRFITSKGHGSIAMYPILAELGFFDKSELKRMSHPGSFLGDIPDTRIPGFETINGALGHGLGVACGIAIALKRKGSSSKVFVLVSDGEIYEGAVWEAIMLAGHHKLNNLILIVDHNKRAMMGDMEKIITMDPFEDKFEVFKWKSQVVNGHSVEEVYNALACAKENAGDRPQVIIAHTIKGKGVPELESDDLCHVRAIREEELTRAIENL